MNNLLHHFAFPMLQLPTSSATINQHHLYGFGLCPKLNHSNPTDTTIIELVKTLVDVEQKTSAAFDTLDTIMTSYAK